MYIVMTKLGYNLKKWLKIRESKPQQLVFKIMIPMTIGIVLVHHCNNKVEYELFEFTFLKSICFHFLVVLGGCNCTIHCQDC